MQTITRLNCFNPRAHVGRDLGFVYSVYPDLVSIHAPTWGATLNLKWLYLADNVSIHAPTWGATLYSRLMQRKIGFQSTRPRGARPKVPTPVVFDPVSIHAPTWGATRAKTNHENTASFNPRAHVGRDSSKVFYCSFFRVSIHAPTWGATKTSSSVCDAFTVSIHAPTWGATLHFIRGCNGNSFNPRAHVGRDRARFSLHLVLLFQSTRPRGARPAMDKILLIYKGFNPRAHVGRDLNYVCFVVFTHCFNPRAHVGRDTST